MNKITEHIRKFYLLNTQFLFVPLIKKILIITIIFFCLSGGKIIFGQAEDINQEVEKNIRIYAGKGNISFEEKEQAFEKIKALGEKVIPKLEELTNSEDEYIRFSAIMLTIRIYGKNEKILIKAINDNDFKIQMIPLYFSKKGTEEYKKWQEILVSTFNQSKFEDAIKAIEKALSYYEGHPENRRYIGPKEEEWDSEYAEKYLNTIGKISLPYIKNAIQNKQTFPKLLSIFMSIETDYIEEVDFLTKNLLNPYANSNFLYALTVVELLPISEHHPEVFKSEHIKRMEDFLNQRKNNKNIDWNERENIDKSLKNVLKNLTRKE